MAGSTRQIMATSRDIARLAGVHQSTVSRVLSGFPGISKSTVDKVRKACDELGYVPNAMARSLRTRRPRTIAVHMPLNAATAIADPFVSTFLSAVGQEVAKHGYSMMLPAASEDDGDPSKEPSNAMDGLEMLVRTGQADGAIITTPCHHDPRVRMLNQYRVPCVLGRFDAKLGPLSSCVDIDNIDKGMQSAAFLLSRGHRRIAVVGEPPGWLPGTDLLKGINDQLSRAGLPIDSSLQKQVPVTFDAAFQATHELLHLPAPPTALIAGTALTAFAVMEAVRQSGRPIQVLGPDSPLLSKLYPAIPRLELPIDAMARAMAQSLIQTIETGQRQPDRFLTVRLWDEQNRLFSFQESAQ